MTLFPTVGVTLSTVLVTTRSLEQYSVVKFLVVKLIPKQGAGNKYLTDTVPSPVKVNVFPDSDPGPL